MAASMSARAFLNRAVPVVVVCGATGTGKSKLAIEIAQRYGGEIISADSMQIYQGLDIITNKVTEDERRAVPHHLLDCAGPLERWTVVDFRRRALPIVERLLENGRMPVIVGGTMYYIESILWKLLVDDPSDASSSEEDMPDLTVFERDQRQEVNLHRDEDYEARDDDWLLRRLTFTQSGVPETLSSSRLHGLLRRVDPAMADTLHPNNRRKIIRSLQAWQQHGRPHSEILASQRDSDGGSQLGGPLRYPASSTVIFWTQCRQEVLDSRLDARVEEMMERGLVRELAQFHADHNQARIQQAATQQADYYATGIFQSIGFKEFDAYLALDPSSDGGERDKILAEAVKDLKISNRRYSRYQVKWIRKRFLEVPDRQVPPVYGLDATDPKLWDERVRDVAFRILDRLVDGKKKKDEEPVGDDDIPAPLPVADASTRDKPTTFHCAVCDRIIIGQCQWQEHLKSTRHRKVVKRSSRCAVIRKPD